MNIDAKSVGRCTNETATSLTEVSISVINVVTSASGVCELGSDKVTAGTDRKTFVTVAAEFVTGFSTVDSDWSRFRRDRRILLCYDHIGNGRHHIGARHDHIGFRSVRTGDTRDRVGRNLLEFVLGQRDLVGRRARARRPSLPPTRACERLLTGTSE